MGSREEADGICESSSVSSPEKDASAMNYIEADPCDSLYVLRSKSCYKKTFEELNAYSLKQLHLLVETLEHYVKEVSRELVELLLENDALQQESDARNIAIEQLLKMTVKVNESDLKPVQMSLPLPDDEAS